MHVCSVQIISLLGRQSKFQGWVVRKPVNVNPGLKVNRHSNLPSIKMLSNAYVLCSLRLFMFKTEGQKMQTEHLAEKLQKLNHYSR